MRPVENTNGTDGIGACILECHKAMMKVVSDKVFEFSEEIESFICATTSGTFEKNHSEHSTEITKIKRKENKTDPKLYHEIANRNTEATIAQLRTGHCGLNHYLHRFGIIRSPVHTANVDTARGHWNIIC
jgi:hypothetical protein